MYKGCFTHLHFRGVCQQVIAGFDEMPDGFNLYRENGNPFPFKSDILYNTGLKGVEVNRLIFAGNGIISTINNIFSNYFTCFLHIIIVRFFCPVNPG